MNVPILHKLLSARGFSGGPRKESSTQNRLLETLLKAEPPQPQTVTLRDLEPQSKLIRILGNRIQKLFSGT